MLGVFMVSLEGSIANLALPSIAHAFGHSVDDGEWIVLIYFLVLAATLIIFGRAGDLIGRKRVYAIGFAIFGGSSLACAFAPSFWWVVAFRGLQAIGSSMIQSCSGAIITAVFPPHQRGRALGINGAAVQLGLAIGPLAGGAIVTFGDWRYIFIINAPIALAGMLWASAVLKRDHLRAERFDVTGAGAFALLLFAFSLALSRAHIWGWNAPATVALLALTPVLAGLFLAIESRVREPMLDLHLFQNRGFRGAVAAATLHFTSMYTMVFSIPLALQRSLHDTGLQAGIALLPLAAIPVFLAPIAGTLSDRFGARYLASAGALMMGFGGVALAALPDRPGISAVMLPLALVGLGIGLFNQPNNSTIMGSAPRQALGVAAGVLATARNTGMVAGTAIAGAIYFFRLGQLGADFANTIAPAKAEAFVVIAIACAVAAISFRSTPAHGALAREGSL